MQKFYKMKAALLLIAAMFSFGAAFAETGSETEKDQKGGDKNSTAVGQSYTIDGTYIAGTGSAQAAPMTSKGLKFRTGTNNKLEFTVTEPYTITRLYMAAVANYAKKDASIEACISVTKVEVDGAEVEFEGGIFPEKGATAAGELTVDGISAKESIVLYFDNSNASGTQINASWAIDWERPEATQPTIKVSPAELALIVGESYQLTAFVDPAKFTTHWESGLDEVATVSEDGIVEAVSAGVVAIKNVWDDDESVYGSMQVYVNEFDPADYTLVKAYDFTAMGDVELQHGTEAAGKIWNAANGTTQNEVFFCTNEGLENLAIQQYYGEAKEKTGWKIVDGEGLLEGSGAGRCAAIGGIKEGQIVEFFYTGPKFYTTSDDDGIEKTAWNESVGRAIYMAEEDGMIGFELEKGNHVTKINIYELGGLIDADEIEIDMTDAIADKAGYLKTFSCQYDLDFSAVEGIKAFVASKSYDNYGAITKLNLKSIDVVPAGTGVLLKADEAKAYTVAIPEFVFVEEFTNDLAVAETDIDLNEAVVTDSWGDFISGPAILAKGTVVTGVDEEWNPIYGEATGFFVADPDTDKLLAGDVYLPVAEGEWDSWGDGYVKLTFTDKMGTYATIGALTATPVHEDGSGVLAALEWEGITADVDWTNGSYMFVKDYTGGLLMQVPEGLTVKAGDMISGSYTGNYTNVLLPQLQVAKGITDASSLMVLGNMGEPTPAAVGLAEAFDESNVMRMVKLSNLKLVVKKGTYSNDYYIQDAEGTEAYLNDAFVIAKKQIESLETGDAIAEMVGVAFIIPEGSPYLTYYNFDQYEFIPLSITGITTGISELKADQAEAPVYSLSGVRVNKAQKGIFIQNGRKVVK